MWNREASPKSEAVPERPATVTAAGEERRVEAWIGKSVVFRGDLISSEDMTIDGRVEGTIEVRDHRLTIGPNAHLKADIVARAVTIFGNVVGSVTGESTIDIRLGASVEADVSCASLAIQEGAQFCGKVSMTPRVSHGRQPATQINSAPAGPVSVIAPADTSRQ